MFETILSLFNLVGAINARKIVCFFLLHIKRFDLCCQHRVGEHLACLVKQNGLVLITGAEMANDELFNLGIACHGSSFFSRAVVILPGASYA